MAVFLAAEPGIDAGCVDIAVSKNTRQMLQIMLRPVEAHGEQVPQIVGVHLLRRNPGCIAQLLHPSPYGIAADRLTVLSCKYMAKSYFS